MGPLNTQTEKIELKFRKTNETLLEPIKIANSQYEEFTNNSLNPSIIQVSAHKIEMTSYLRECQSIFSHVNVRNIIAIPTMQHAPEIWQVMLRTPITKRIDCDNR